MKFSHLPAILLAALGACSHLVATAAEDEFIPPEQAFRYSASTDGTTVTVAWSVATGYYLYQKRMGLATDAPGVSLGEPTYPAGEMHEDEYFGKQTVFRGDFTVTAPLAGAAPGGVVPLELRLQGCADAGLCYPPTTWRTSVTLPAAAGGAATANKSIDTIFGASAASNSDEFLDPEQAFILTAVATAANRVELDWVIAPGYYLYKSRMKVAPAVTGAPIGTLVLPTGEAHSDEYFGEQEVYRGAVQASFSAPLTTASAQFKVTYQGCADAGLCYPPITKTVSVALPLDGESAAGSVSGEDPASGGGGRFVSEQDRLAALIRDGKLVWVLLSFFGAGLLLAFTPCVLPMVPILSGLIAGQGDNVPTGRAFGLSVAYVLGMASMYTGAGIAAGALGSGFNLQATFNQPWIIILFGTLFVVLALSMFGLFTIQMPAAIQTRLTDASNKQQAGNYAGVALMGALSSLIVTACVAPPLIAALTVISQTGDMVRGGSALFAMSLGMGTPLLLVGASAGKLLPRAGAWMDTVKNLFGVMLLGVAAWMFARIVPGWLSLVLWAVPALVAAWLLWQAAIKSGAGRLVARTAGVIAGLYGVALLAGAALGGNDPLAPIPQLAAKQSHLEFTRIKTVADLDSAVAAASNAGRSVMLDFYADWCVSCKEMEKYTFTASSVQAALGNTVLLQADVTANDADDRALLQHFDIFGPPTIAFYGPDGIERRNFRVVGYMKAPQFAAVVRAAVAADIRTARSQP
ncbi:MAG TPA: protein-disulfide reductase DsbD [Steroidobacteraceae bacterium]|nr:protein-disulfide reductase DsbD [Steroidobacteraceae bacterium]